MTKGRDVFRLEADTKGFVKGYDRARISQSKLNQSFRKTAQRGKTADKTMGKIVSKVGGFLSLATAVGTVTSAKRDLVEQGKEAADLIRSQEESKKRLLQISDTKELFQSRERTAKRIASEIGISVSRAETSLFVGISSGLSDKLSEQLAKAIEPFTKNPEALIGIPKSLQFSLGTKTLGGTEESQFSALLAGAKAAKANVEQIAEGILLPASSLKTLGASGKEGIAALATVTNALGNVEIARTALASLATDLKVRFRGKGLTGPIQQLAQLSPEQRDRIITNKRSQRALEALVGNFAFFSKVQQDVATAIRNAGTPLSLVRQKAQIAQGGELGQLRATKRAEARREVALTNRALRQLRRDEIKAAVDIVLEKGKAGIGTRIEAALRLKTDELLDVNPENTLAGSRQFLQTTISDFALIQRIFGDLETAVRENTEAQTGTGNPKPIIRQPG